MEQLEGQLKSVSQKLLKYDVAFEKGTMSDEDAAPRIRDLRAEQVRLQRARDEALAEQEDSEPKELNRKQVLEDVSDLKSLLSTGIFMEQKGFPRSFIKGIDFEPGKVAINYTIPLPVGKGRTLDREVLSIGASGEPGGTRTRGNLIKRYKRAVIDGEP